MAAKEGFYDWIAGFEDLEGLLPVGEISSRKGLHSLVIGCGTALFSEKFGAKFAQYHSRILATDNDEGCIAHMNKSFPESTVEYVVHDIVEDAGRFDGESFDFVLDKGTFDAIHVEGSVALLLKELNRLLRHGGSYVLVSINSENLLSALFSMPGLGLSVESITDIPKTADCRMAIIKKTKSCSLSLDTMIDLEHELTDCLFKAADTSLLSDGKLDAIRCGFASQADDTNSLSLRAAHSLLFPPEEGLGYDFDLFLEDVAGFPLVRPGRITLDEALTFVRAME